MWQRRRGPSFLQLWVLLLLSDAASSWTLVVPPRLDGAKTASGAAAELVRPPTRQDFTVVDANGGRRGTTVSRGGPLFTTATAQAESAESTDERSTSHDDSGDASAAKNDPLSAASMQQRLQLLRNALVEFNSTAANQLLKELSDLRSLTTGTGSSSTVVVDSVLDRLLEQGPDRTTVATPTASAWVRRTIARVLPVRWSERARWESLRRTLDLVTPPPNEDADDATNAMTAARDTTADQQRRRRRALVSLLRTLARPVDAEGEQDDLDTSFPYRGGVAIRHLERKAYRESPSSSRKRRSDVDLTLRRPKGLETPQYKVVEVLPQRKRSDGTVEIRSYEPYSVCTVSMDRPRPANATATDAQVMDSTTGGARAFGALAGYLFGKNQQQQAMAMTTPVISQPQRSPSMRSQASGLVQDGKVMSFVMPSQYWDRDALATQAPQPLEGSGVALEYVEGGFRAVLMFGGYASQSETNQRKLALRSAVDNCKGWEVVPDEPITLAQYNDPFTPPWKRVNEVSVLVRPVSKKD